MIRKFISDGNLKVTGSNPAPALRSFRGEEFFIKFSELILLLKAKELELQNIADNGQVIKIKNGNTTLELTFDDR